MLEGYFDYDYLKGEDLSKAEKRLRAVRAALEIAKASAGAANANARTDKVEYDLSFAAKGIKDLADAIEEALK